MNAHYDPLYLFINGEWIAASERDTAPVINPASLQELGRVPEARSLHACRKPSLVRTNHLLFSKDAP